MSPQIKTIIMWVGIVLVAALFVMTGGSKLAGSKMMVDEFGTIGLGQWFRYLTGLLEVGGALALLWPKTSFYGAVVLLCVVVGAFITQAFVLHGDVIHTLVIGALVAALAWFQRPPGKLSV